MKFTIIKKQQRLSGFTNIEPSEATFIQQGSFNSRDLRSSEYNKYLSEIPQESQIELDKTGKTVFTVLTTTVVSINKKAT